MNAPGIMDYEEYSKVASTLRFPYFYTIGEQLPLLHFYGSRHSFDPTHSQFEELRSFWNDFRTKTEGHPCVAMVEGALRHTWPTEREAIRNDGEAGFLTLLAAREGVRVECPEPDRAEEYRTLLKRFKRDDVLFYYIARVVAQWYRVPDKPAVRTYLEPYFTRMAKFENAEVADFDFNCFCQKMGNYGAEGFDVEHERMWRDLANPTLDATIINTVSRASSTLRDEHIAGRIVTRTREGTSVFVVFGSSHAVMQEPYLRAELGD